MRRTSDVVRLRHRLEEPVITNPEQPVAISEADIYLAFITAK
jgi:hypothetical protein